MEFDIHGNLKGGIIDSDIDQLKTLLVDNVSNTTHRKKLYDNFLNMLNDEIIKAFIDSVTNIYVDGSFCTSKEYPGDIDIIALINLQHEQGIQLVGNEELKKNLRIYIKEKHKVDFLCTPDSETLDRNANQYDDIYNNLKQQEKGWISFFRTDRNENNKALVKLQMYEEA
ncbi:DUF6932 family protein [Staphylococcus equorum]|uniref:DUF6932 family protein n=1 Tax=Staphylococcus equorum TaxID=246432 RepID=UPI003EBC01CA